MNIEALSAITLATRNMPRAVTFYETLGFERIHGGTSAAFTSFRAGDGFLNLILDSRQSHPAWWGRVIFYVSSVDETYRRALAAGFEPEAPPRDAEWGERYFHLRDPDGYELSFARPLARVLDSTSDRGPA